MDKQELVTFLQENFAGYYPGGVEAYETVENGFKFDVETAIYYFSVDHHSGQDSELYAILSSTEYHPGMIGRGPERDSMGLEMYNALVGKYIPSPPLEKLVKVKGAKEYAPHLDKVAMKVVSVSGGMAEMEVVGNKAFSVTIRERFTYTVGKATGKVRYAENWLAGTKYRFRVEALEAIAC